MSPWLVCAAATALALAGGGASAAPARDTYSSCLKHAQSTFDMDECVGKERQRLGPLLAAAYNKLLKDPDSNAHRKHLIAVSQKAWIAYRSTTASTRAVKPRAAPCSPSSKASAL